MAGVTEAPDEVWWVGFVENKQGGFMLFTSKMEVYEFCFRNWIALMQGRSGAEVRSVQRLIPGKPWEHWYFESHTPRLAPLGSESTTEPVGP
jgi:hypothetical protein